MPINYIETRKRYVNIYVCVLFELFGNIPNVFLLYQRQRHYILMTHTKNSFKWLIIPQVLCLKSVVKREGLLLEVIQQRQRKKTRKKQENLWINLEHKR